MKYSYNLNNGFLFYYTLKYRPISVKQNWILFIQFYLFILFILKFIYSVSHDPT